MGIFADLFSQAKTIDADPPAEGERRAVYAELAGLRDQLGGDMDYPSGYDAIDEVQVIPEAESDDGTYTITVTLANGESFTTGNINHDDNAAAIESAIDSAATNASVTGWTNGDISVSGGPLDSDDVTLTFDGDSVAGANHPLVTVDSSLTLSSDPVAAPTATATTEGQSARPAWAILRQLGVIAGTPPVQGTSEALTAGSTPMTNPYYPDQGAIRALAREAAIADGNEDVEAAILTVAGLSLDGR